MSWPPYVHVWTDGACRGNPGAGATGVVVRSATAPDGKTYAPRGRGRGLARFGSRLGRCTNNEAEYEALLGAVNELLIVYAHAHAQRSRLREVKIHSDSQLVVRQVRGQVRARA